MHWTLSILLAALFLLLASLAWASSVFALPGNWIALLLALLYGWAEGFTAVRPWVFLVGVALAALGEGAEFLSGYFGTKTFGGSRWAGAGALLGAIFGAIFGASFGYGLGAIPGTVLGAFLGAGVTEFVRVRRAGTAVRVALGASLGRALGLGTKLALGAAFLALLYLRVALGFLSA